jgi:hypothetical protein
MICVIYQFLIILLTIFFQGMNLGFISEHDKYLLVTPLYHFCNTYTPLGKDLNICERPSNTILFT